MARFSPPLSKMSWWISRIRFGAREVGVEIGEDDLRHRQAEGPGDLAGDELGNQCACALPGSAELEDIESIVVRVHDCRQRSALAQRRDVSGDPDGTEARTRPLYGRGQVRLSVEPALTIHVYAEASRSVAMSIFFICIIACMTRLAFALSGCCRSSGRALGTTCHEMPYLSASQPH